MLLANLHSRRFAARCRDILERIERVVFADIHQIAEARRVEVGARPRHLCGLQLGADEMPATIVPERGGEIDRRDSHRCAELDDAGRLAGARDRVEEAAICRRDGKEIVREAAIDRPVVHPLLGEWLATRARNERLGNEHRIFAPANSRAYVNRKP